MHARHIMSIPVTTVGPTTSIDDCLRIADESGFTALPVVEDEHLVGIVSEGDLLREKFHNHPRTEGTAADAMTSPVVAMTPETEVSALASAMLRSGLRAIPIVENGKIVGIVTRRDLLSLLTMDETRILHEVQHRLDVYAGPHRWTATVTDGRVDVSGADAEESERRVVAALAETVPGVTGVRVG
ncbi:CBS domain-containing protein [Rhodococcus rhodochrous]|uniref:CBS domain-containing protein n=1 Tax=Rhodococcus rhodochrous TaxID=1829 RepID=UPI00132E996F|nr:CBS domain-containing protein [Rhodococcus rhodochrous]QHG85058.1 CBS domain-containing protein [Rhodococcus rhodochrous]QOH59144.1 CBS domain-containing protein [Rhodococcus rhodochrous]